jgi:hypothetical protein
MDQEAKQQDEEASNKLDADDPEPTAKIQTPSRERPIRTRSTRTQEERIEARQKRLLARSRREESTRNQEAQPNNNNNEAEPPEDPNDYDIEALLRDATKSNNLEPTSTQNDTTVPPLESHLIWQDAITSPIEQQIEQEQKLFFKVIDGMPVTLPNAEGKPFSPRFVEQEGIFVGQKPNQMPRYILNRNRLEQRLLRESPENVNWFSQDGHIDNQPTPLKPLYERPSRWFDPTASYMQTQYIEPATTMVDVTAVPEKMYQLELDILSLKFYDHPLFCKEDILASQLELLYMEYQDRQALNLAHFYSEKLQALELHLADLKKNPQLLTNSNKEDMVSKFKATSKKISAMLDPSIDVASKLTKLRETIRQTRILRDIEEHNDIMIVKKMIAIWNQLKELREQQGYTSTGAQLVVKKTPADQQADMDLLQSQLESELREMKDDHDTLFAEQLDQYRKQLRAQGSNNNQEDNLLEMPQYTPFDEDAAKIALLERYKQTKRKPGSSILTPVFSKRTITEVTPTATCDPQEQARRLNIERTQIYLKLLVNNKFVTKTKVKHPNIDFTVEFGEMFTLQLVKWPDNLKLQVVSILVRITYILTLILIITQPANTFSMVSKEMILAELFLRLPGNIQLPANINLLCIS